MTGNGPGNGQGAPIGADREARLGAALRSNIAKRKARAAAQGQDLNPPHDPSRGRHGSGAGQADGAPGPCGPGGAGPGEAGPGGDG